MTEKLYGLDDIPEGWVFVRHEHNLSSDYYRWCFENEESFDRVCGTDKNDELALHKAIQKAKGEV